MRTEAQILQQMQGAPLAEQMRLVAELDEVRAASLQATASDRSLDLFADDVVERTFRPVVPYAHHTAATDWMDEDEQPAADSGPRVMAAAASWIQGLSPMVMADADEFVAQARGMARRTAGLHALGSAGAEQSFLDYALFLRNQKAAASGLDQIQQITDANNQPKSTSLPQEVFDTFEDAVDPINRGVDEEQASTNAPLMQQIVNGGDQGNGGTMSGGGRPSQHDEDDEAISPYSTGLDNPVIKGGSLAISHVGTLDDFRAAQAAQQGSRPPFVAEASGREVTAASHDREFRGGDSPNKKVGDDKIPCPNGHQATYLAGEKAWHCPTCGWQGPPKKEGASGLTQVEETVDANNQPHPEQPMPGEVAFPLVEPWASTNEGETQATPSTGEMAYPKAPQPQQPSYAARTATMGAAPTFKAGDHVTSFRGEGATVHRVIPSNHPGKSHRVQVRWDDPEANKMWNGEEHPEGVGDQTDYYEENFSHSPHQGGNAQYHQASLQTQADMFGASDAPGARIGVEPVANSEATAPKQPGGSYASGVSDGRSDRASGERPSFADKGNTDPYVQGYVEGFSSAGDPSVGKDVPPSLSGERQTGNDAGASQQAVAGISRSASAATQSTPDYRKGFSFAASYTAGTRLVSMGSPEFEAGLYDGIRTAGYDAQAAFVQAHEAGSQRHPVLATRLASHKATTERLRRQAATSTDLDTMAPSASPLPDGQTPINGAGTTPPLAGGSDPAAPGGPAPYNGAMPTGSSVVPGVQQSPAERTPAAPTPAASGVNMTPSPTEMSPTMASFRRRVQSGLLAQPA